MPISHRLLLFRDVFRSYSANLIIIWRDFIRRTQEVKRACSSSHSVSVWPNVFRVQFSLVRPVPEPEPGDGRRVRPQAGPKSRTQDIPRLSEVADLPRGALGISGSAHVNVREMQRSPGTCTGTCTCACTRLATADSKQLWKLKEWVPFRDVPHVNGCFPVQCVEVRSGGTARDPSAHLPAALSPSSSTHSSQ